MELKNVCKHKKSSRVGQGDDEDTITRLNINRPFGEQIWKIVAH